MIIESEHVPETTTIEIILEGREIRNTSEQIEMFFTQATFLETTNYAQLIKFMQEVRKAINNPKPKENGDK